ncbi:uncharacterized protein LOC113360536 [Papaver somniferum]|uniref:uncharacterized protein LOC113360536 n=1 Tax=Papaver somniferum TaxID=3469 RepID=UPI000E6FDA51|nr:uncharacterized protein LOC113360536 [Papaver somniferum]
MNVVGVFSRETIEGDMRIPLVADDKFIWNLTKNGIFTLKSTYNKLHEESLGAIQVSTTIQHTNVRWKQLWDINTWPRVKHFWWKCLSDSLPSRVRVSRNGGSINQIFPFCNQTDESFMHDHFKWINTAMIVSWTIWNERCEVIFQNKKVDPIATARKALSFANYIENLYTVAMTSKHSDMMIRINKPLWKPPAYPFLSMNCDASFNKNTGLTGIALILRDYAGNWRGCKSKCYARIKGSEEAECLAFSEAVNWSLKLHHSHIVFETDLQGI